MKRDLIDILGFIVIVGSIIFGSVALLINTSKSCDVHIDYDVTVDPYVENVTSDLVQVKYACLKLCIDELSYSDVKMYRCFEQCEALG